MFYFNKGSLKLGNEWKDKSLITLVAETQSVTVTYSKRIPYGMTFHEFCDKEITDLGKQLTDYKELSREQKVVSSHKAVFTEFIWTSPKGKFHQMTLMVDMKDGFPAILTCTNLGEMSPSQRNRFLAILNTFEPRD